MQIRCRRGQKIVITDSQGRKVEIIIFKVGIRYIRMGIKAPHDIYIERIQNVHNLPKDRKAD